MFLVVASIIAGVGLGVNNSVAIVASMLVSPLMGPILGEDSFFPAVCVRHPLQSLTLASLPTRFHFRIRHSRLETLPERCVNSPLLHMLRMLAPPE